MPENFSSVLSTQTQQHLIKSSKTSRNYVNFLKNEPNRLVTLSIFNKVLVSYNWLKLWKNVKASRRMSAACHGPQLASTGLNLNRSKLIESTSQLKSQGDKKVALDFFNKVLVLHFQLAPKLCYQRRNCRDSFSLPSVFDGWMDADHSSWWTTAQPPPPLVSLCIHRPHPISIQHQTENPNPPANPNPPLPPSSALDAPRCSEILDVIQWLFHQFRPEFDWITVSAVHKIRLGARLDPAKSN